MSRFNHMRGPGTRAEAQCRIMNVAAELAHGIDARGFSMTKSLPLECHIPDARDGLRQPLPDDPALTLPGRSAIAAVSVCNHAAMQTTRSGRKPT